MHWEEAGTSILTLGRKQLPSDCFQEKKKEEEKNPTQNFWWDLQVEKTHRWDGP